MGYPKPSISELMAIYDELTAIGLQLLPKRYNQKFPVSEYWQKGKVSGVDMSRQAMLKWQLSHDVCGWCVRTGRVYVVDMDTADIERSGQNPETLYDDIQELSESGFVLASPSGGVHIYYRIPDNLEVLPNCKLFPGVDGRGEGGQVVTIGGYNRYDGDDALKKAVPEGHYATYSKLKFGIYNTIPVMSIGLYNHIKSGTKKPDIRSVPEQARAYQQTEQANQRVTVHRAQLPEVQKRIVLEALSYALKGWKHRDYYQEWLPLWMSAYDGCNHTDVLDYILNHPDIEWKYESDRSTFVHTWSAHNPRETEGYTVATLFWLARRAGWLSQTGAEITAYESIQFKRISDWFEGLPDIPKRLLLVSQTGSGKTYSYIAAWKRLNQPKSVIVVPTTKLAKELYTTLRQAGLPAILYVDSGATLEAGALRDAALLVTTLQTFAIKARPDMSEYGLVLFEESDELFRQFARGGGGMYGGSHVRENEAQEGFKVIADAFAKSEHVFCYDATMSKVTETIARSFSTATVRTVVNSEKNTKAPVTMLPDIDAAYQVAINALASGERVVVACDTARAASDMLEMALMAGVVKEAEALVITARTENDPRVSAFMQDVNGQAELYRLVCYNSAMGSGVSITSVQPDTLVQIADYLTPRHNLQILNRYRRQNKVFVFYRTGENLYAPDVETIRYDLNEKLAYESGLMNVPLLERNKLAAIRAEAAIMATADEQRQNRAPRDFYMWLLRGDGRRVSDEWAENISGTLRYLKEALNEVRKEKAAEIARTWNTVQPVDHANPAPAGMVAIDYARGIRHAEIKRALLDNIPTNAEPEIINRIVSQFEDNTGMLYLLLKQERTFELAERTFLDRSKAVSAIENKMTRLRLSTALFALYHSLDDVLTPDLLEMRVGAFKAVFDPVLYDRAISRNGQKFSQVYQSDDDTGSYMALAKIMLAQFGLKQRAEKFDRVEGKWRMQYRIANADDLRQFIAWRHPEGIEAFSFEPADLKPTEGLTPEQVEQVLELFDEENPGSVDQIRKRLSSTEW